VGALDLRRRGRDLQHQSARRGGAAAVARGDGHRTNPTPNPNNPNPDPNPTPTPSPTATPKPNQALEGRSRPQDIGRAAHILLKHQNSRRLASWRDPDGEVIKQLT
jgi:hypothetical protein